MCMRAHAHMPCLNMGTCILKHSCGVQRTALGVGLHLVLIWIWVSLLFLYCFHQTNRPTSFQSFSNLCHPSSYRSAGLTDTPTTHYPYGFYVCLRIWIQVLMFIWVTFLHTTLLPKCFHLLAVVWYFQFLLKLHGSNTSASLSPSSTCTLVRIYILGMFHPAQGAWEITLI